MSLVAMFLCLVEKVKQRLVMMRMMRTTMMQVR
jgi:hypothetical protein